MSAGAADSSVLWPFAFRLERSGRAAARVAKRKDGVPCENMTLPDVIRAVLTEPISQTVLTVRMRGAEFDSSMNDRVLRQVVGEELREGGFRKEGEKWVVAGEPSEGMPLSYRRWSCANRIQNVLDGGRLE